MNVLSTFAIAVRRRALGLAKLAGDKVVACEGPEAVARRQATMAFQARDAAALGAAADAVSPHALAGHSLPGVEQRQARLRGWREAVARAASRDGPGTWAMLRKAASGASSADSLILLAFSAQGAGLRTTPGIQDETALLMAPIFARRWCELGGACVEDEQSATGKWLRERLPIPSGWLVPGAGHRMDMPGADLAEALGRFSEGLARGWLAQADNPAGQAALKAALADAPSAFSLALGLAWSNVDPSSDLGGLAQWAQGVRARREAKQLKASLASSGPAKPAPRL